MVEEEGKAHIAVFCLQILLALWQVSKLTPVAAVLKGAVGWLLGPVGSWLGLPPSYIRLQSLPGCIFKKVPYIYVFEERLKSPQRKKYEVNNITWVYLGKKVKLQRQGNILSVNNGEMRYYITQHIWNELAFTASPDSAFPPDNAATANAEVPITVFVENYKEIFEQVATGTDMTYDQVLDRIILDGHTLRRRESSSWLLPVDLSVSEEKVLKILNFAGLILQIKKVYWLIPLLLSLISTVLEFCTPLRIQIYEMISVLFCCAMHKICNRMSHKRRRQIYGLGKLVDYLKPTNDIELKVTKCNIIATIAGGAKVHTVGVLTSVDSYTLPEACTEAPPFQCGDVQIRCSFVAARRICYVRADTFENISVFCRTRDEFLSILTLLSSIARNRSGSLKSHGPDGKVRVRGLRETLHIYMANNYPKVYEMELENVVVN